MAHHAALAARPFTGNGGLVFASYRQEFGHALVPNGYVTKGGFPLGSWVSKQRLKYHMAVYREEFGHCMVPVDFVTKGGFPLVCVSLLVYV